MADKVDVVVVGMGPGGEDLAANLASAGLRVVGIERSLVGGECPYWGCVPTKMMIRAANLLAEARRVPGIAGTAEVKPDWATVAGRIRSEATDSWDDRVAVDRFVSKGGRRDGHIAGVGNEQAHVPARPLRQPQPPDFLDGLDHFVSRPAIVHRFSPPRPPSHALFIYAGARILLAEAQSPRGVRVALPREGLELPRPFSPHTVTASSRRRIRNGASAVCSRRNGGLPRNIVCRRLARRIQNLAGAPPSRRSRRPITQPA